MQRAAKRKKLRTRESKVQSLISSLLSHPRMRDAFCVALFGLFFYLLLAFTTPWAGILGFGLRKVLLEWFGEAAYFTILLPLLSILFLLDSERKPSWLHFAYLLCWFVSITLFFSLFNLAGKSELLLWPLKHSFGMGGTVIFSWTFLIVATVLVTNLSFRKSLANVPGWFLQLVNFLRKLGPKKRVPIVKLAPSANPELRGLNESDDVSPILMESIAAALPISSLEINASLALPETSVPPKIEEQEIAKEVPEVSVSADFAPAATKENPFPVMPKEITSHYTLPDPSLFDGLEPKRDKGLRIEPSDYSRLLEETLRNFDVEASVVHVERGPTVTRYELQPAKGVKVSKIVALSDDLALALAATSLRIEAPIPGKSAIGIEVPNTSVAMVYFRDLLNTKLFQESPLKMILVLGKDIAGQPIFTDLKRMPHLLIAGATGSGKTVCINTLIASILFKATPHEVQFIMIDPKRVELTIYDGIPHLIQEVVTDPKEAAKVLIELLAIMDERYSLFKEARVRSLEEYNRARPETPLPYIVVLVDELADLMMLSAATVESSISRLTALARAAGIHLIVATQRPSVDVITGIIKANIPSRVAFAVSSIADSRTILDTGSAEKLLGRGDMLFAPMDAMKPLRLQGAYVGLNEIETLVSFWTKQLPPENLVQFPEVSTETLEENFFDDGDELYLEAKDVILRTGQASVSTLQRKLKIGYARAGRLMDLLEKHGIVGQADGAKPRKILIPNPFRPGSSF